MTFDDVIENRKKWEEALASGEWIPLHGFLNKKDTNECCCLGVGCFLFLDDKTFRYNDVTQMLDVIDSVRTNGYAPRKLVKILGLVDNPGNPKNGRGLDLAQINDQAVRNNDTDFSSVLKALKTGNYYISREEWENREGTLVTLDN